MKFTEKRLFLNLGLIFCAIQALLYVPVHLAYTGVFSEESILTVIIGAFTSALTEFAAFLLPLAAAAVIFISYAYGGLAHALPRVLFFSVPYLLCAVPSNYLTYLSIFDTSGALFFSLLISLFIVFAVTVQMLALFGVICFFYRMPKEERFGEKALSALKSADMFDFSNPFAKGLFGAVAVQFVLSLIPEIIETVTYFINRSGAYRTEELFTIIFTYLFMALEILLAYILVYKVKDKLIYERLMENN